jgi:hypothetical protein
MRRLSESCIVIGQRTSSIEVHKHLKTQGNAAESWMPVSEIRTPRMPSPTQADLPFRDATVNSIDHGDTQEALYRAI